MKFSNFQVAAAFSLLLVASRIESKPILPSAADSRDAPISPVGVPNKIQSSPFNYKEIPSEEVIKILKDLEKGLGEIKETTQSIKQNQTSKTADVSKEPPKEDTKDVSKPESKGTPKGESTFGDKQPPKEGSKSIPNETPKEETDLATSPKSDALPAPTGVDSDSSTKQSPPQLKRRKPRKSANKKTKGSPNENSKPADVSGEAKSDSAEVKSDSAEVKSDSAEVKSGSEEVKADGKKDKHDSKKIKAETKSVEDSQEGKLGAPTGSSSHSPDHKLSSHKTIHLPLGQVLKKSTGPAQPPHSVQGKNDNGKGPKDSPEGAIAMHEEKDDSAMSISH